ncbi:hypothetical protein [Brevibacillus borstelensis]|uniref:hypothetical protein n=1 Tax=Brevibacillus borstelensis TaxID=45462 RepID=UPI00057C3436|nr:hypothetical protein [Brevibacillus borstelensis]
MFSPAQMVQSLMQRTGAAAPKPIEFTPGQVFTGAVVRTYPENMALVQIGGMQVQAKLEANLEAGQRAWLQVQPTSGVITLKVLNSPQGGTVADASLEGLMRSLGFAETKENRAIVQALVSSNLPVNRDAVQSYAAVTQQLGADQGTLDAFLLALKRNLPVTPDSIAGLKAFLSEKPLAQVIQHFLNQADSFLQSEEQGANRFSQDGSQARPSGGSGAGNAAADLLNAQLRMIVGQLRDKVAKLPVALPHGDVSESPQPASNSAAMAGHAKGAATGQFGEQQLRTLTEQVSRSGNQPFSQPRAGGLTTSADQPAGIWQAESIGTGTDRAASLQSSQTPRNDHPILEMFRQLGLSHERDALGHAMKGAQEAQRQLESVKSLLLQLASSSQNGMPAGLRDAADTLLQQVTGQQLMLAQPSNQPFAQVVMQIPIRTNDGEDTAYVQIESKKKGGGELDPENCRLFFHLDLNAMGTTMLDVGIVNRIVNIQVFNNNDWVEPLVQNMREGLADQLQGIGYQISSMRVQSIPDADAKRTAPRLGGNSGYMLADYKGVDFRV